MTLEKHPTRAALYLAYQSAHNFPKREIPTSFYRPHQYRGGFVIPGFGFENSRIRDGLITEEEAGDPVLACSWSGVCDLAFKTVPFQTAPPPQ